MQRHVTTSAQQDVPSWIYCAFSVFGNGQCMVKFNIDEIAAALTVRLPVVLVALDLLQSFALAGPGFCGY